MLYVPYGGDFRWQLHSHGSTRPAAGFGATVTASSTVNTMGAWSGVITTPTDEDAYGILINVNAIAQSASSRQALLDIGIDEAGGTSYSVKIPYLYVANASNYNTATGGVWYYFPLFIPAGCTIGARLQSVISSQTARCTVQLFGQPSRPEFVRYGTSVEAIGVDAANSAGTVIVPGTTSEGSWTDFGSPTSDAWWWQAGYGQNDTSTINAAIHIDVAAGDASNKKFLIENMLVVVSSAEQVQNAPFTIGCVANVDAATTLYMRAQSSASADSNVSGIIYALS